MREFGHLVLSDGTVFFGNCFYEKPDIVEGELVFSTATTGYTEIISDPSYFGQILVLANPEIGNYGVNVYDQQSASIKVRALIVRNLSSRASSHRSQMTLTDWFLREGVPIFYGVDTRSLIEHIRIYGSMMAALSLEKTASLQTVYEKARELKPMSGQRLSQNVCVQGVEIFNESSPHVHKKSNYRVVVLDFGVKREILRYLNLYFAEVIVVPGSINIEDVWAHVPDGIFLSNGPGDPNTEDHAVSLVRKMLGKVPIFGVCLGHQILAQALGYSTYKMPFGHRGSNHSIKNRDGQIIISAQNHGFAVLMDNVEEKINQEKNISDETNEGLSLDELGAFSVQFHPEGAPGPHDAVGYFDRFVRTIDSWKKNRQPILAHAQDSSAVSLEY